MFFLNVLSSNQVLNFALFLNFREDQKYDHFQQMIDRIKTLRKTLGRLESKKKSYNKLEQEIMEAFKE